MARMPLIGRLMRGRDTAVAPAPTPDLLAEIATTANGRDITQPWIGELKQPLDRRLWGPADWGPYDRVLLDDQVKACLAQRIGAVVSRDWHVLPGDEQDPRSVEAAEALTDEISAIGWDRVTEKMLYAVFFGYSVAELIWAAKPEGWGWDRVHVRHARRFRFDKDDKLRLLTTGASIVGEPLPDRKFWVVRYGGTDDDHAYGRGLAEWLYWPVWFKRNGVRFWNVFLDKYSVPTVKGTYPRGATKAQINDLLSAIQAIATDTGIAVPEGFLVELIEQAKQGADFGAVCRYMDGAIAKVILSQTMTTDNGSSRAQADVHADVKLEIVKADADLLTDSFAEGPARWWTDFRFGPDVAAPRVVRVVEEPTDLKAEAETDNILAQMGWELTDEAFADKYGEGYERKVPAEPPPPLQLQPDQQQARPPAANDQQPALKVASFAATDRRPLYVYRQVKNAEEIMAWAVGQGFASLVPPGDLHVTIAYSKTPVNWFAMASDFVLGDRLVIDPGGPRVVDRLGEKGAIVMHFWSEQLSWRNRQMRDAGASWDFPQYLPHITLTYQGGDIDLAKVQPYTGRIVLGPEIFEPIEEDWHGGVTEVSLAEPPARPSDVVDQAVEAIAAQEGWVPAPPPIVALIDQLKAAVSVDDMIAILRREVELGDQTAIVESLARAGFAIRLDALTDDGGEA